MKAEPPGERRQFNHQPQHILVWLVVILIAATFLLPLLLAIVSSVPNKKLQPLTVIAAVALVICGARALRNPLRGRTDQMTEWRQQFPTASEQEVDRFLKLLGESLGTKRGTYRRFRPQDKWQDLSRGFGWDGLELVELMMAVDSAYHITLPDEFLSKWDTIGDLFRYVTKANQVRASI